METDMNYRFIRPLNLLPVIYKTTYMKIKVLRIPVMPLIVFLIVYGLSCWPESDENILRKEFAIPAGAETIHLDGYPASGNQWFGREGLRIDISFQFNDTEFDTYVHSAVESGTWDELPIPREFLMKMGGIQTSKDGLLRSYQITGDPVPEEGSVYNPTIDQLFERFVKTLPLNVKKGYYQCRSAGDNIMHKKKTIKKDLDGDLNDFMLAVLDVDKKQLHIKVGTRY